MSQKSPTAKKELALQGRKALPVKKTASVRFDAVVQKGGPAAHASAPKGASGTPLRKRNPLFIKVVLTVVALLFALCFWRGGCLRTNVDAVPQKQGGAGSNAAAESEAIPERRSAVVADKPALVKSADAPDVGPVVSSVRLIPSQPIATDHIRAEASVSGGDVEGTTFTYQWKINERFVPGVKGKALEGVELRRRDRISVVVTAMRDGKEGPKTESQTVIVYCLPPSLEMKIITERFHPGEVAEIQITGAAPDGDKITFSLVSPFVDGMKIDAESGRILWTPGRLLQGKFQFGVAAVDTDKNRTVRVFEIDLGTGQQP